MFTRITQLCVLALLLGSLSALADRDPERDAFRDREHFEGRGREHPERAEARNRDRDRDFEGDARHDRDDRDRDDGDHGDGDWDDNDDGLHERGGRKQEGDRRYREHDGDERREGREPRGRDRDGDWDEHDFDDDDLDEDDYGDDPFGGDDAYGDEGDYGDDPFGGEEEMWIDDEVRRAMGRGGLEAVSRMVGQEFGTPKGEFLEFVRKQMPEVTQAKGPRAVDMVSQAVNSYAMFVELREHDPEQAELMVANERMEMMSGQLAENVEILRRRARRDGSNEVKQMLKKNESQLKTVLGKLFELRQKQQEYEVRDLEAEVQELRELAERRAQNRERIVERQFMELTGQGRALEW